MHKLSSAKIGIKKLKHVLGWTLQISFVHKLSSAKVGSELLMHLFVSITLIGYRNKEKYELGLQDDSSDNGVSHTGQFGRKGQFTSHEVGIGVKGWANKESGFWTPAQFLTPSSPHIPSQIWQTIKEIVIQYCFCNIGNNLLHIQPKGPKYISKWYTFGPWVFSINGYFYW